MTDATTARFENIELNPVPTATRTTPRPPAPVRPAPTPTPSDKPEPVLVAQLDPYAPVSAAGARAVANDKALLANSGVQVDDSELYFAPGTTMYAEGTARALASRAAWEKLPTAQDAAVTHAAVIAAEKRADKVVNVKGSYLDHHGNLVVGEGRYRPTPHSWSQLRALHNGADVPHNFNSWLPGTDETRRLRTRFPSDTSDNYRELYAAVSENYTIIGSDEILSWAADKLPAPTRARVQYSPRSTHLQADLSLHNPYEVADEIAVGRLHRIGFRFTTSDRGDRRLDIRAYVERIRCRNCTLLPKSVVHVQRTHRGNPDAVWQEVTRVINHADALMRDFAEHWEAASMARIFDGVHDEQAATEAFVSLIRAGWIKASDEENMVTRLVSAWGAEPGNSYQAINRAITRAAHTYQWSGTQRQDLEEQAGQLLYQRVQVFQDLSW
jgi:hypothetical protein